MRVEKTEFDGLLILQPKVFKDERGTFIESWNKSVFKSLGVNISFIQDNQDDAGENVKSLVIWEFYWNNSWV